MTSSDYFSKHPSCRVIGPQLGPLFDERGVLITIGLPHRSDIERLTCRLFDASGALKGEAVKQALHPTWRNYRFEFSRLDLGQRYSYGFFDEDNLPLDLEPGLSPEDCEFETPQFKYSDRFVLLSCNNPFYSGLPEQKRLAMWDRLLQTVLAEERIKLLVQGGDQVYHDDIEKACLRKLATKPIDEDGVAHSVILNYQHFYAISPCRKILARVPSVAMLDDHDITDGWGGRPESFTSEGVLRPEWERYRDLTYDAFKAYQTSKNPPVRISSDTETTFLDFGDNRLYLLDLRREKNTRDDLFPLVSAAHERRLFESIYGLKREIKKLFVLSPVVPVRINPEREALLEAGSRSAYAWRLLAKEKLKADASFRLWWFVLYHLSGFAGASDLTDDLTDALSSKKNRKFLVGLLARLAEACRTKTVSAFLLSGDVHVGGISEIFVRDNDKTISIPQIVSSPIGYEPMSRTVKDATTEEWDYEIKLETADGKKASPPPEIRARNIFYRSDRNFCVITPGNADDVPTAEFHFENLREPLFCSVSFCRN